MSELSSTFRRNLRVNERTLIDTFRVAHHGEYVVDPPVWCEPGKRYLACLDWPTRTARISEVTR